MCQGARATFFNLALWSLCVVYSSALAQSSQIAVNESERFALLVGVDDYAPSPNGSPPALKGPANDVRLMKELLVARYGFKDDANHLAVLIGREATRDAILVAFKKQLIDNARAHPDAIVVFYFSGHGSQSDDPNRPDEGLHDTLVAYDSHLRTSREITDTELIDLLEELRRYTSQITFILDSCHSGAAIRDAGTLTEKDLPVHQGHIGQLGLNPQSATRPDAKHILLTRRQQFVLLSAAHANEKSFEDEVDTPSGRKYHGLFTYYLAQLLMQRPDVTVEEAIRLTNAAVAKDRSYQHPQAVGNMGRRVFGGAGDQIDPYVKIVTSPIGGRFQINAGALHGLRVGAFLAVYSADTAHLSGESGKIANARVSIVGPVTSTAELVDPDVSVPENSKIAIVTPFFGFEKLRVRVSDLALGQKGTSSELNMLARLASLLERNELIETVKSETGYNVAIRRGCVLGSQLVLAADMQRAPPACLPAYYLSPDGADHQLFGFYVFSLNSNAAAEIAEQIQLAVKQNNLRGLNNAGAQLNKEIAIKVIKINVHIDPATGAGSIRAQTDLGDQSSPTMNLGESFQLKIENGSGRTLYAAIIMLGSSGRIELMTATADSGHMAA
jgi:uncharacterized caspase-like protein